jgi:Putative beta barrel porin-7 (BBP7)
MRKGLLASVAALAAGAGVASGQGWPGAPAGAPPAYPGYGQTTVVAPPPGAPAGPPATPPNGPATPLPPATEMPHAGPATPPGGVYDPWAHGPSYDPGVPPGGYPNGQVHKAAGGPDRSYLDIEWLLWGVKATKVNFPLVTAGPVGTAGLIGQPDTVILFDNKIDYGDAFNVLRLTGGWWDRERVWGLELSGFIQEEKSAIDDFVQPLHPRPLSRFVLARPAIDALTGQPTSVLVAVPDQFGGEVHVKSTLKMGGAEASILRSLMYCDTFKFNLLAGVRYVDHDESLKIVSRSTVPVGALPDLIDISDEFAVRNQFFGGQIGFQSEFRRGRYFMDLIAKLGLGNMREELDVIGFTNTSINATNTSTPGGFLALDSNIGHTAKDRFGVLGELTVKLGYQLTQRISAYVGYNFLGLSKVLRPGEQIDPVLNPTLIPVSSQFGIPFGPARPATLFKETEFWTQGATLGLSIRY